MSEGGTRYVEARARYVYSHILEALSGGLYPNKLDVVREYIQNSYDAIREIIREADTPEEKTGLLERLKIELTIQGGSLFIHDNATGMNFETLDNYRRIGFSKKVYGAYAGWRGIGKAAGLAIAEKLIVTTSKGDGTTYMLTINAKDMTDEVRKLRPTGGNIPFDELIEKHSEIKIIEGGDSPFTTVELHKVKEEASELLDKDKLKTHLAMLAPVPFRPDFLYAERIRSELEPAFAETSLEYTPVKITVDGDQIFKPYMDSWKESEDDPTPLTLCEPSFVSVYDDERLVAFAWYCMHTETGQINKMITVSGEESVDPSGLLFRVVDIKVGDSFLTKSALWTSTPELALWAVGEVHVLDKSVELTSDRNDFIDNYARFRLFQACNQIAREISRKAKTTSRVSSARRKINESSDKMNKISADIASKNIQRQIISTLIYEVESIKREAKKRKPRTKDEDLRKKADDTISLADQALEQLTSALEKPGEETKIYEDVVEELSLTEEARSVYDVVINTLRDYYAGEPDVFKDLVTRINKSLRETLA